MPNELTKPWSCQCESKILLNARTSSRGRSREIVDGQFWFWRQSVPASGAIGSFEGILVANVRREISKMAFLPPGAMPIVYKTQTKSGSQSCHRLHPSDLLVPPPLSPSTLLLQSEIHSSQGLCLVRSHKSTHPDERHVK